VAGSVCWDGTGDGMLGVCEGDEGTNCEGGESDIDW
jgi:hypothetical protein